jgi:protocatechuate 3,4-dioxygenase beta subunit
VSKRGYRELSTQMYFAGESLNGADTVLNKVPEAERPRVVISPAKDGPQGLPTFQFDLTIAAS